MKMTTLPSASLVAGGFVLVGLFALASPAFARHCYVDKAATGANTGDSWVDAYTAFTSVFAWGTGCQDVYVATGIYKPSDAGDRYASFHISHDYTIYGGYSSGTPFPVNDPLLYPTIFSGDIDNNDFVDARGVTLDADDIVGNNSYHVFYIGGDEVWNWDNAFYDIIITGGRADGAVFPEMVGGGVYCDSGSTEYTGQCSEAYHSVQFIGNYADYGGGLYSDGRYGWAGPSFKRSAFLRNEAGVSGGAVYVENGVQSSVVTLVVNSTFYGNKAMYGGAFYMDVHGNQDPVHFWIWGSTFAKNSASVSGGTFYIDDANGGILDMDVERLLVDDSTAPAHPIMFAGNGQSDLVFKSAVLDGGCPATVDCEIARYGDPELGPLALNGGDVPNLLPASGGLATELADCGGSDQRYVGMPQGLLCDAGSVEVVAQTLGGWMTDYMWYVSEGNLTTYRMKVENNGIVNAYGVAIGFDGADVFNPALESWDCRGFRGSTVSSQGSGVMLISNLAIPSGAYVQCVIKAWLLPGIPEVVNDEVNWVSPKGLVIDQYGTREFTDPASLRLFRSNFEPVLIEDF